ncbi:SDR family NAD(P)-dependent oxidoreductase [Thalassobaculum sp. OXR-137]|uniref:SDR family NAD(P)-dependent oxidoreductase n=1 Tax=Thalassobaculum sp. OXR-137 TaxID=3100173 RepID=UPI002AC91ED4|nr:SDR family NAD(P)-dependent oxidoreductase [Thalassobaculum sp. OXR-137]WPZ33652.1 SDR family NAD(P)-dependent oxidoreductase [Thalassobaculum sp. OXR-137]
MTRAPKTILITGASSGLGAAVAEAYAAAGIRLYLSGRNADRLAAVAERVRDLGAACETAVLDVCDAAAVKAWVEACDDAAPLDLVVANAGISAGTAGRDGAEPAEQVRAVFATNVDGVLNTILPAIGRMEARGHGQVALVASLAGYRGIPGAPSYCASKAAVKVLGEGLRGSLHGKGIRVSVICPGYVRTPMTAVNDFPMPFMMEADQAARIIRRGLARDRGRIAFPWPMAAAVWLLQTLPPAWIDPLLRRLPRKGGE